MTSSTKPSSNWFALQNSLVRHGRPRKRRKIDHGESSLSISDTTSVFARGTSSSLPKRHESDSQNDHIDLATTEVKNGESIAALRRMVLGKVEYKISETDPGKYVALDCEMVGVGIEGSESSLARVSMVDYTGATILDAFVQQREKVVDYRTKWSGIRSADLTVSAKPFREVQQTVADLIKDRILVGHAIYNDLKALLLSHPSPQIRDTQSLAYKHRIVKSHRPALRVLVKQELGIVIQGGEHSSVTDARATMALFRLYRKQWEVGFRSIGVQPQPKILPCDRKKGRSEPPESDGDGADEKIEVSRPPGRSRSPALAARGVPTQHTSNILKRHKRNASRLPAPLASRGTISSGISTITSRSGGIKEIQRKSMHIGNGGEKGRAVRKNLGGRKTPKNGEKWWKYLGGKKGSIKL